MLEEVLLFARFEVDLFGIFVGFATPHKFVEHCIQKSIDRVFNL